MWTATLRNARSLHRHTTAFAPISRSPKRIDLLRDFSTDECVPVGPNPPFVATGFINLVTAPADSKRGMPGPAFSAAPVDDPANYKWNRFHFEVFCRNSLSRKSQQSRNPCAAHATIREIVCL
ncbi:hypothetical protein [Burkholderia stagnalis]|uniref:hypothetical protein n=1 Tax=Burkholderia stagnalis TaxID=1503054 RepID=UPI0012DA8F8B|nr:hypothetical protein [Burkholderia stagnalis]